MGPVEAAAKLKLRVKLSVRRRHQGLGDEHRGRNNVRAHSLRIGRRAFAAVCSALRAIHDIPRACSRPSTRRAVRSLDGPRHSRKPF